MKKISEAPENIIWDDKERYYSMLKEKVQEVMIRKIKSDENPEG